MTIDEVNMTIDYLKEMQESYIEGEGYERHPLPEWYALDKAIEALEQEPVIDKIRERVELEKLGYPPSADYYKAIMKVLQIIDKYKGSEDKE
jgi:hypothetical protein